MRYRRAQAEGGTFFFTVNLADRSSHLLIDHVNDLRAAVKHVKQQHPFEIVAWVVLPDHLHAIWALPERDPDFATRWMLIKSGFSRRIELGEVVSASRLRKRERGIWQRRYWEHQIRDDDDLAAHLDYVHHNPVKHGHVERASEWAHSSIHRYVRLGLLNSDWAVEPGCENVAGESPG